MEHSNVIRLFAATDAWFHFNGDDVWTLFHSYAFDFSVWEIWGALLIWRASGRRSQRHSTVAGGFLQAGVSGGVTVLNQTPSAFRQLIAARGEKRAIGCGM